MKPLTGDMSEAKPRSFNYNKLQAVACIASSAAVSIGMIYWLVQTIF